MFGRGKWWSVYDSRSDIYGPFCWLQAEKGGGPVLREQGSWRKINGFMVRWPKHQKLVVIFRRHSKWGI